MSYRTCENCGANIDTEETCNCEFEPQANKKYKVIAYKKTGTLHIENIETKEIGVMNKDTVKLFMKSNNIFSINYLANRLEQKIKHMEVQPGTHKCKIQLYGTIGELGRQHIY